MFRALLVQEMPGVGGRGRQPLNIILFDLFDITMCMMQDSSLSIRNMRLRCSLPDLNVTGRFHLRLLNIVQFIAKQNLPQHGAHHSVWFAHKSITLKEIKVSSDQIRCG